MSNQLELTPAKIPETNIHLITPLYWPWEFCLHITSSYKTIFLENSWNSAGDQRCMFILYNAKWTGDAQECIRPVSYMSKPPLSGV